MAENLNLFTSTQDVIQDALNKLGYDEGMFELLKEPFVCLKYVFQLKWMMVKLKFSRVTVHNITML